MKKTRTSLRTGFLTAILICWLVPIFIVVALAGVLLNENYRQSVQQEIDSSAANALRLVQMRFEDAIDDSKAVSYDGTVRDAYRTWLQNGDSAALYGTVTDYLSQRFTRGDIYQAVFIHFWNVDASAYVLSDGTTSFGLLLQCRQCAPQIVAEMEDADTDIRLLLIDGQMYMARNLLDSTFTPYASVVMLLQRDQAWEMDVPEKVCARLSRNHDIYGFSYAERSVFVMLVGLDSQERGPLVRELELLAQEPEFAESKPRFALGIPFEKLTQAPQSYMDALSAGRRMTGEGVAVYEQSEPEETPFYPEEELQALETALNHQDRNRTAFLYDILMTMVSRNRHVYLYTVTLLSEMIRLYTQALPEENGGESGCGPVVCGQCVNDVEDMLDCLRSLHTQALQHMAEQDLENSATEMTGIANYISSCEELDTLTVSTVAERYGMNASSLSHRFKKQMGCNISDYIFTCKMNHACALLRSTDQTVAEIAQQVGYSQ